MDYVRILVLPPNIYLDLIAILPQGGPVGDILDEYKTECRRPKIDQMETESYCNET